MENDKKLCILKCINKNTVNNVHHNVSLISTFRCDTSMQGTVSYLFSDICRPLLDFVVSRIAATFFPWAFCNLSQYFILFLCYFVVYVVIIFKQLNFCVCRLGRSAQFSYFICRTSATSENNLLICIQNICKCFVYC